MQAELDRHFPSSQIDILGVNEWRQESANSVATAQTDLPWLQDVDGNNNQVSDVWYDKWQITYRDVWILNGENELVDVYNLTQHDLGNRDNFDVLRSMIVDAATADRTAASPWQNRIEPYDVNNDGSVFASDVLAVIQKVNLDGTGELPAPTGAVSTFYDVTGDNVASARDALFLIRFINLFSLTAAGEPEEGPAALAAPAETEAQATMPINRLADQNPILAATAALPAAPARQATAFSGVDAVFALIDADDDDLAPISWGIQADGLVL